MLIGYARVSTKEQELNLQLDALRQFGCEKIYQDQMSGVSASRPGLTETLNHLRSGDCLVVWKLDRLGRQVHSLIELVTALEQQGVHFISLTDHIDTSSASGRFFFHMMASLAQMERELLVERTKAGLDAARQQGRIGGRKRRMTDSKLRSAQRLLDDGVPPKEVALNLGVSVATLYRWLPASKR
ncbi:recombinase family protein [Vibrio vulnificus]|nr:recombinase family protein [Vibrio vulnificus]MCU8172893.1 recombinase family protein [Vibrio vulnificus]